MKRQRSRYAPDDQVRRIVRVAAEMGIKPGAVRLGADGSVSVLDSARVEALGVGEEESADDAFAKWKRENGPAGRQ